MAPQTPSIGRIVHFQRSDHDALEPAVITAVHSDQCVNLRVFCDHENETRHVRSAVLGDGPNEWRWPVFVPPRVG